MKSPTHSSRHSHSQRPSAPMEMAVLGCARFKRATFWPASILASGRGSGPVHPGSRLGKHAPRPLHQSFLM